MAASVPGLHKLISVCQDYSKKWRFTFGIKKTRCITIGSYRLCDKPVWLLDGKKIECVKSVDILGINFNDRGKADSHCTNKITSSRRAFYGLSNVGMCETSLSAMVKSYLWKSVCSPSLLYGVECLPLTEKDRQQIDSAMGSMIKQSLRLSKFSHHSHLLQAMNIEPVSHSINTRITKLFAKSLSGSSPHRSLCTYLLSKYIYTGTIVKGTLLERVILSGASPMDLLCQNEDVSCFSARQRYEKGSNGIVDTMQTLLFHDNFIKPWSAEYNLLRLLTSSF